MTNPKEKMPYHVEFESAPRIAPYRIYREGGIRLLSEPPTIADGAIYDVNNDVYKFIDQKQWDEWLQKMKGEIGGMPRTNMYYNRDDLAHVMRIWKNIIYGYYPPPPITEEEKQLNLYSCI